MRQHTNCNHKLLICLVLTSFIAASHAQFNIDVEVDSGSPVLDDGPPSPGFGAAAGQAGFWTVVDFDRGPTRLRNIRGHLTPAYYTCQAPGGYGGINRNLQSFSGDFAFLLNDGFTALPSRLVTLYRLGTGTYDVYTYNIGTWAPYATWTEVTIKQSIAGPVRVMQSPTAGDQFTEGFTHTIHRVHLRNHEPLVISVRPTVLPYGAEVGGFQIVPVKS